ncbi:MAG: CoA-transferase subunit beta [Syntrophales bacterium]|nr:CoA-transferase subunit beta [Syntrophales bacterium]
MAEWTIRQMMVVALARQFNDGKTYVIGTGLPLISATLAKNTTAPKAVLVFESGIIDGFPQELPTSVSDLRINFRSSALVPQYRYFGLTSNSLKKNKIELGFLGGAQIDPYGNLNATAIGDYYHPKARFTGSGGANGIATYYDTVIMMQHQKRRFCRKVDYVTSPGWVDGPGGRERVGLPKDKGPRMVVTEMGIMRFDEVTKRMYVAEYFPGVTLQKIQDNTGFELDLSRASEFVLPDPAIQDILINKVDPQRLMI